MAFHVENKGLFPYDFVNTTNLNYVGLVPSFNYFSKIKHEEWNEYNSCFIFIFLKL